MWSKRNSHFIASENAKQYSHLGRQFGNFFPTKPNLVLPYDSAIRLLGIYLTGLKAYRCKKTCVQMFIAALSIITQNLKNKPKHSSIGQWINKLEHPHNGILFSNEKKCAIKPQNDLDKS